MGGIDPTGEVLLGGAAVGAVVDIGLQLLQNGENFSCIKWGQVAKSALLGAVGAVGVGGAVAVFTGAFKHSVKGLSWLKASHKWGAVSKRLRRVRNLPSKTENHHGIIANNGSIGKHVPDSIKNHPLNIKSIPKEIHTRIHGADRIRKLPRYNVAQRWWHGTPDWAKTGQAVGGSAGGLAGNLSGGNSCECSSD